MSPPRVLHVVESWPPVATGNARRSWEIVSWQKKLGISAPQVLVSSRQHHYNSGLLVVPDDLTVEAVPESAFEKRLRPWRWGAIDRPHLRDTIITAARDHRADLIHVHRSSGIGQAAAQAARALRLPVVAEVRFDLAAGINSESCRGWLGPAEWPLRRLVERHLPQADAVVAASHALAGMVRTLHPRCKPWVVPNGIHPVDRLPEPAEVQRRREALGIAADDFVIGTTSTMYRYEGLKTLIALAEATGVRLLFVGDGPQHDDLRQRAGSSSRVVLTGRVPPAQVPLHLALIDLFVIPRRDVSITRYASPLKLVEAMAHGRPVLATPCGDIPSLLAEKRGFLAEATAFPAEVQRLRSTPAERAAAGARARQWIHAELPWEKVIETYRDVYQSCLP
ncbi:MAG: glycosyltransferase [Opitutales bacterium]